MQSLLFACEYKTLESWRILKVRLENCFSWKSASFNIGRIRKFAFKGRGKRSSGYVGKFHRKWSKFGTIVYSKTKTKRKKFKLISIFSNQEKLYKICSTLDEIFQHKPTHWTSGRCSSPPPPPLEWVWFARHLFPNQRAPILGRGHRQLHIRKRTL